MPTGLPPGIALNPSTGAFTGSPTTAGTYTFTVQARDSLGNIARLAESVTIQEIMVTGDAPEGLEDSAYSYSSYAASGGAGPYTWSIASGALPTGLSINAGTGAVTGTPTVSGSYTFTVRATDAGSKTGDLSDDIYIDEPDEHWASVVSLLHFDDSAGSETFTDEKGVTWTPAGSVADIATGGKFGNRMLCDTRDGRILSTISAAASSDTWTVECWLYFSQPSEYSWAERLFFVSQSSGGDVIASHITWDTHELRVTGAFGATLMSATMPDGEWVFVEFSSDGAGNYYLFLNGQLEDTYAGSAVTLGTTMLIGGSGGFQRSFGDNSRIDECRITVGVCRNTVSYTAPTRKFPNG